MGISSYLDDFNKDSMARKVAQRRQYGGVETPRNSLELPMEASHGFFPGGHDALCSYLVTSNWPETYHPAEGPMKKLINEEVSKHTATRYGSPSLVARLMGVEMLPVETKPVGKPVDIKKEKQQNSFSKEDWLQKSSVNNIVLHSNSSKQRKFGSLDENDACEPHLKSGSLNTHKYKPREHPQEEELQKFKKEFEAWQAARFKECSKFVELDSTPSQLLLAQDNLNKEKMNFYANSKQDKVAEKTEKFRDQNTLQSPHDIGKFWTNKNKTESLAAEQTKYLDLRARTSKAELLMSPSLSSDQKVEIASAPTKIVILRPGFDRISDTEESWASSPGTSEDRGSIEDFLEEVKERLKRELQGKSPKRTTTARGGGIETPYSEKPPDPKHIAQSIANNVRDSVRNDFEMNLIRSESTRSYRSETQLDETGSPEFINRDTRKFLAERLRNVLKEETRKDVALAVHGNSRPSRLRNESRLEQSVELQNAIGMTMYEDLRKIESSDIHSRSFRQENEDVIIHQELSPRNLIRSMSAPVSGTSFGKLLLEDPHVLTGAHIRRKHEGIESVTLNKKKRKKDKFNFREKVSGLKYSFTLRGMLFGRKIPSAKGYNGIKPDVLKDILSGPTVMMNICDRYENSTEVPPSPASVCSSANEEFWRASDHFSQSSASDIPPLDESDIPYAFREISSNLNELRKQLSQLGGDACSEITNEELPDEVELMDINDQDEAYVRDLLVASGLYDGSCDRFVSRWDPLGKPISIQVFEEVESSYSRKVKGDEDFKKDRINRMHHKLLFDLLNETLSRILGPPASIPRFMKNTVNPLFRPLQGRKLLDQVWEFIHAQIYPSAERSCQSLESMVARDLQAMLWKMLVEDDINALGKELECQVIGDLIGEAIKELH